MVLLSSLCVVGVEGGAGPLSQSRSQLPFLSWVDGELYAGVYVDFMGTDSAIFRTLGTKTAMRTDQYNSRWLNGECLSSLCVTVAAQRC